MSNIQYPKINGYVYDHASLEISLGDAIFVGITDISYKDSIERGQKRGTDPMVLGLTRGQYSAECSLTMGKEEADAFLAVLGDGFMDTDVAFDITVNYSTNGSPTITDKIVGCRLKTIESASSQGTDPLSVPFELDVSHIVRDGKNPLKNMRV